MPPDEERRLVWADELLERGDPRGELITTQCALERGDLPREDSLRLRRREAELLAQVDAVGGLEGLAKAWTWTRGAIEEITTDPAQFERHRAEIFERAPFVHRLRLPNLRSGSSKQWDAIFADGRIDGLSVGAGADLALLAELEEGQHLAQIRALNLFNIALDAAIRDERLQNLEELSLNTAWDRPSHEPTRLHPRRLHIRTMVRQRVGFDLDSVAHPDFFSRLEELDLEWYAGRDTALRGGPERMQKLRRLRLPMGIASAPLDVIENPERLVSLEELSISFVGNEEEVDLGSLVATDLFPKLRVLRIGPGLATAGTLSRLLRAPLGRRLEVLDLRQNRWHIPDAGEGWDGVVLT